MNQNSEEESRIDGKTQASRDKQILGLSTDELEGSDLYAADNTLLGKVTRNSFDTDSLANEFGTFGNPYSSSSIFNEYATYGNPYSQLSPFNEFSRTPPRFVKNGRVLAYLTTNQFITPRVDPTAFKIWLRGQAAMLAKLGVNRSAKQRCCLVPVALSAPAPGYAERYVSSVTFFRPRWASIGEKSRSACNRGSLGSMQNVAMIMTVVLMVPSVWWTP